MVLEMASGNFFYRLERYAKNDNLEAIGLSLNMLAEEIQEFIHHQGFLNRDSVGIDIVQMSFILDKNGNIEMVNQESCDILSVPINEIIGQQFASFLDLQSNIKWKNSQEKLSRIEPSDTVIELNFRSKSDLIIPKIVYLSTFKGLQSKSLKFLVTVIHHSNQQDRSDDELKTNVSEYRKAHKEIENEVSSKYKIKLSYEDIRKIRKGRDIILTNLEADFPTLREFALQLGTNEFKLKYGFRELYGTSVHRFLMNERFRKAQMMIQYTDQSLKSIAHINGFKSSSHFSRAFKKKYGYAPSDLRKKATKSEE